jgi:hypothetical protein
MNVRIYFPELLQKTHIIRGFIYYILLDRQYLITYVTTVDTTNNVGDIFNRDNLDAGICLTFTFTLNT